MLQISYILKDLGNKLDLKKDLQNKINDLENAEYADEFNEVISEMEQAMRNSPSKANSKEWASVWQNAKQLMAEKAVDETPEKYMNDMTNYYKEFVNCECRLLQCEMFGVLETFKQQMEDLQNTVKDIFDSIGDYSIKVKKMKETTKKAYIITLQAEKRVLENGDRFPTDKNYFDDLLNLLINDHQNKFSDNFLALSKKIQEVSSIRVQLRANDASMQTSTRDR